MPNTSMPETTRSRRPFIARAVSIFVAVVVAFGVFAYFVGWPHLRETRMPPGPNPTVPGQGTPLGRMEQAGVPYTAPYNDWLVTLDPRSPGARQRAGASIVLMDTAVKELAGDQAFWIGAVLPKHATEHPETWMLVVRNNLAAGHTAAMPVTPGMQVRVAGILEIMPSNAAQLWNLTGASVNRAVADKIYILANKIEPGTKPAR